MYGLRDSDIASIQQVMKKFPEVESAWLYGSRVKGTQKHGSDVDIAVKGKDIPHETILQISAMLNEEVPLPYHFDVTNYHSIQKEELKEHITRVGQLIYQASRI